jgi:hypothetical protein
MAGEAFTVQQLVDLTDAGIEVNPNIHYKNPSQASHLNRLMY